MIRLSAKDPLLYNSQMLKAHPRNGRKAPSQVHEISDFKAHKPPVVRIVNHLVEMRVICKWIFMSGIRGKDISK